MFSGMAAQLMATKGLSARVRMVADEARVDFLARAAFAGDEHGGIVLRDLARKGHQPLRLGIDGDQFVRRDARGQLAPRHVDQGLRIEGLDDVVGRALAHGGHRLRHRAVGRHQHHRQIGPQPFDRRQQLVAVRRPAFARRKSPGRCPRSASSCNAAGASRGRERRQSRGAQGVEQCLAQRGVVLDHQYRFVQFAHA